MSVAFGMENEFQLKGNTVLTKEAWRWFNIHPIVFLVGKTAYIICILYSFSFFFASGIHAICKSHICDLA